MEASNVLDVAPDAEVQTPTTRQQREVTTSQLIPFLKKGTKRSRERAMARLIETNMPVAKTLARRYAGRGIPIDDLEQVAYLGLVAATQRFDDSQGGDLLAYAIPTIKGELRKTFRDSGWMVRPPRRLQELQARVWAAESELIHELQRAPRPAEIAERIGAEIDEVNEALSIDGCFAPSSLDVPVGDGEATTYADRQGAPDPGFETCEARTMLGPVVRHLPDRDRRIIEMRYFRNWTQQEIAEEIGVTQTQVSRLLSRILRDLRSMLTSGHAHAA